MDYLTNNILYFESIFQNNILNTKQLMQRKSKFIEGHICYALER